jgi:hypothetical protein
MNYKTPFGLDVSVEIMRDKETDTAKVIVHSPMYIVKLWEMSHSYKASQFSDHKILRDSNFVSVMLGRYEN